MSDANRPSKSTAREIIAHTGGLMLHFGCTLDKVDPMLIRIARLHAPPPPDWLRRVQRLEQLPRYSRTATATRFSVSMLDNTRLAERLAWVVETLADNWSYADTTVNPTWRDHALGFESGRDAVYYRLAWGGE